MKKNVCLPCRFEFEPCGCMHCKELYEENVHLRGLLNDAVDLVIEHEGISQRLAKKVKTAEEGRA